MEAAFTFLGQEKVQYPNNIYMKSYSFICILFHSRTIIINI